MRPSYKLFWARQYFYLANRIESLAFSCHYTEASVNRLLDVCKCISKMLSPEQSELINCLSDVQDEWKILSITWHWQGFCLRRKSIVDMMRLLREKVGVDLPWPTPLALEHQEVDLAHSYHDLTEGLSLRDSLILALILLEDTLNRMIAMIQEEKRLLEELVMQGVHPDYCMQFLDGVEVPIDHVPSEQERSPVRFMYDMISKTLKPVLLKLLNVAESTNSSEEGPVYEPLYAVHVETPERYSPFQHRYAVTEQELEDSLFALGQQNEDGSIQKENGFLLKIADGIRSYKREKLTSDTPHLVADQGTSRLLVSELEIYGQIQLEQDDFKTEFRCVNNHFVTIRAEHMKADIVYVGDDGMYFRFVRAALRGVAHQSHTALVTELPCWKEGQNILVPEQRIFCKRLLLQERQFSSREDMERDMRLPTSINFDALLGTEIYDV